MRKIDSKHKNWGLSEVLLLAHVVLQATAVLISAIVCWGSFKIPLIWVESFNQPKFVSLWLHPDSCTVVGI